LYFISEQGYRDKHIQVWELTVGGYNNGIYTAFYSTNMRGVAARALHLSGGVEKPSGRVTYIVVLM